MQAYLSSTANTDTKLQTLESDLDNSLSLLRQKGELLTSRHKTILKRQAYLMERHYSGQSHSDTDDNFDIKSDSDTGYHEWSDIIKLNIGGEKMAVWQQRDTLTAVNKGSRLEVIFCGRWDDAQPISIARWYNNTATLCCTGKQYNHDCSKTTIKDGSSQ